MPLELIFRSKIFTQMPNILEKDLAGIYFFVKTCFEVDAMWT